MHLHRTFLPSNRLFFKGGGGAKMSAPRQLQGTIRTGAAVLLFQTPHTAECWTTTTMATNVGFQCNQLGSTFDENLRSESLSSQPRNPHIHFTSNMCSSLNPDTSSLSGAWISVATEVVASTWAPPPAAAPLLVAAPRPAVVPPPASED